MPSKSKKIASRQAKLRNKRKKEDRTPNLTAAQINNTLDQKVESQIEPSQKAEIQESKKTSDVSHKDSENLSGNIVSTSINLKSELVRIGITASIIFLILAGYSVIQ
tara:strand:+ start:200 stop:520 length:321 start_codon:yes stop_codon:yes gene_type:complete